MKGRNLRSERRGEPPPAATPARAETVAIMRDESYESLTSWRRAMDLVETIYRVTRRFPNEEKSGLAAALRKTVATIPAKIADAHGRSAPREAISAFSAAQGSIRELETTLLIARRLGILGRWSLFRLRRRCAQLDNMIDDVIDSREELATVHQPAPKPPTAKLPLPTPAAAAAPRAAA